MSYSVVLTAPAKNDLREIYKYIAFDLQSEQNAAMLLDRLEKAIGSLRTMPERFRVYEHPVWKERNLRIMPVDKYLIFYIPSHDERTVTILRIMYGGRDIDNLLHN